jgi:hypothetical protein
METWDYSNANIWTLPLTLWLKPSQPGQANRLRSPGLRLRIYGCEIPGTAPAPGIRTNVQHCRDDGPLFKEKLALGNGLSNITVFLTSAQTQSPISPLANPASRLAQSERAAVRCVR